MVYSRYISDVGHHYGQSTPVNLLSLLTSIMWPYCELRFRVLRGHMVFEVAADQELIFLIESQVQARLICSNSSAFRLG